MSRGTKDLLAQNRQLSIQRVTQTGNDGAAVNARPPFPPSNSPPPDSNPLPLRNPLLKQPLSNRAVEADTSIPTTGRRRSDPTAENPSAGPSASLFPSSAHRTSNAGAEVVQVEDLKQKLERQKMELENRTDNVNAIQRNFQRLSEMYSSDRQKLIEAEGEIQRLLEELNQLRSEKKLFAALRLEFAALQQSHQQLKDQLEAEAGKYTAQSKKLEETVRTLERENKSMSSSLAKIGRDLQSRVQDDERMKYVVQDAETAFNTLLLGLMEWQKSLCNSVPGHASDVGSGISFVAQTPSTSRGSVQVPEDENSLRVEVLTKSIDHCSAKALTALQGASEANTRRLLEAHEREKIKIMEDVAAAQLQARQSDGKNRELTLKIEEMQQQFRQLQALHQVEKDELKRKMSELESRLDQTSSSESAALQAAKIAVESLRIQLVKVEEQLRSQQSEWDLDKKQALRHISDLEENLHDVQKDLDAKKDELQISAQTLAARQREHQETKASLESDIKRLKREIQQLQENIGVMKRQIDTAGKASQAADAKRIQELESQLQSAKASQAVAEANRDTVSKQLADTCAELELLKKSDEESRRRLAQLSTEQLKTEQRLRDYEVKCTELMAERSQLLMDLHSLEDGTQSSKQQIAQLQSQHERLRQEKVQTEVEVNRLKEELQRASGGNKEAESLRLKNKQLMDEVTDLKSALLNASALSQVHQAKIQELTKAVSQAELQYAEAKRSADAVLSTQATFDTQRLALEQQRAAAEARLKHVRGVQEETLKTVRKLINVEKACESGYSCQSCLQLLKDPITCAPCGHVYCRKCLEEDKSNRGKKSGSFLFCPECDDNCVSTVVPIKAMDLLTGKFQYRCQVLGDLSALLEKDLMAPEQR